MSCQDIQYSAIIERQTIAGEVFNANATSSESKKSHSRALALSIALQAKTGEAACIKSNKETAYFAQFGKFVIIVMANSNASTPVVLSFMRDVQRRLKASQSKDSEHTQEILEKSLEQVKLNRNHIDAARSGIDDVRKVMVENIDEILQRNERLGLLVDRTSQMSQSAHMFNRQAGQLERKMWYSNFKLLIIAAVVLTGLCTAALKFL